MFDILSVFLLNCSSFLYIFFFIALRNLLNFYTWFFKFIVMSLLCWLSLLFILHICIFSLLDVPLLPYSTLNQLWIIEPQHVNCIYRIAMGGSGSRRFSKIGASFRITCLVCNALVSWIFVRHSRILKKKINISNIS